MFLPIPAIDLMGGEVVRLRRGEARQKTVYSNDPVGMAKQFELSGARRLHIVDLDGAFAGELVNLDVIVAIRQAVKTEIELGGGLRTPEAVACVLELGVNYVILGTSALRDRALVRELVDEFKDRIIVGIDARKGRVAIEGWVETSEIDALDFAHELEQIGVATVIFTDIAADGMLTGPNLASVARLADATVMRLIASGGIRHMEDLEALCDLSKPNLIGAIAGRAIYEGTLDLTSAFCKLASGPNAINASAEP